MEAPLVSFNDFVNDTHGWTVGHYASLWLNSPPSNIFKYFDTRKPKISMTSELLCMPFVYEKPTYYSSFVISYHFSW
jgi:hypothetical protein